MLIYYSYFIFLLILSLLKKYEKNLELFIVLSVLCFYGFSYRIGIDRNAYERFYWDCANLGIRDCFASYGNFEPGFVFIGALLSRLSKSYQFFLFCLNALLIFTYSKAFKKLNLPYNSSLIFACFVVLYGNRLFISTLRQAVALSFFLFALSDFLWRKKIWILKMLLGALFHTSILIMLPIFIFYSLFKNKYIYIALLGLLFFLGVMKIDLTTLIIRFLPQTSDVQSIAKVIYYLNNWETARFSLFDTIEIVFFMCVLLIKKKKEVSLYNAFVVFALFINIAFPSLSILTFRLQYYFGIGFIVTFLEFIKHNKKYRCLLAVMCTGLLFLMYTYKYNPFGEEIAYWIPYNNYLIESCKNSDLSSYYYFSQ